MNCLEEEEKLTEIRENLKTADPKINKNNIISGIKRTFYQRRKFVLSNNCGLVLLEYPRFVDTYGLVSTQSFDC